MGGVSVGLLFHASSSRDRDLGVAEGASYTACLAVVLGKGLSKAGMPVPLGTPGSNVAVPDEETEAALDWREET